VVQCRVCSEAQETGHPEKKIFQTKLELGLDMVRRAKQGGLPLSCFLRRTYGRDFQFRADLEAEKVLYAAFVPANQRVYLQAPEIGLPKQPAGHKGRIFSRERV